MNTATTHKQLTKIAAILLLVVMALVPFTAFFTTWLGSQFGHLDLFRIWKEVLIATMAPIILYIALADKSIRKWLVTSWLVRLVLLYILLHVVSGYVAIVRGEVNRVAFIYSMLVNLRFLAFFMLVLIVSAKTPLLARYWRHSIFVPASLVIVFGLMQLVLPPDFLTNFGYGPSTIPATHTVDQKLTYRRIQSTLRGPNPLGAYMVAILPIILMLPGRLRRLVGQLTGAIVLFFTYSRSAMLGLLATAMSLAMTTTKLARKGVILVVAVILLGAGLVFVFRDNDRLQNTLFHTDEASASSLSANASRLEAMKNGVTDIYRQPLGRGPGTAGPASTRNNKPSRLADNYYIQIGQEVGIIGLALFLAILGYVARLLWKNRQDALNQTLFAVLVGLSIVNTVSHAWADDTLAYIYWGLAAIALAPAILEQRAKQAKVSK